MKVFISADIEGITGVTHWDETDPSRTDYSTARQQMTAEVAAACEGALQAGAHEILVKDAHNSGRNILASSLPLPARLVRGWSGHPLDMVQELDRSFDAVFFIGYHSGCGMDTSPLAHTNTGALHHIYINDLPASEFLIHAYAAAWLQVPVVFVSGDQGLCDEILRTNPHINTLAVKQGIGDSTINIHPELAVSRIRECAAQALLQDRSACLLSLPPSFFVRMEYKQPYKAFRSSFYPGARLDSPGTVIYETGDYFDVLRMLKFTV